MSITQVVICRAPQKEVSEIFHIVMGPSPGMHTCFACLHRQQHHCLLFSCLYGLLVRHPCCSSTSSVKIQPLSFVTHQLHATNAAMRWVLLSSC
jgi:ABC-type multidrug transport system permease subunit